MHQLNAHHAKSFRLFLAGVGVALSALLLPLVVSAVAPPANTVIGNQAAATYVDASGRPQTALSNQVNTTVAQIGGLTLSNTGNKTAAAGNTVYIPHTLTNTGNGTDAFTLTAVDNVATGNFASVALYADTKGTGIPSGQPLCASPLQAGVPLCSTGFVQMVGGNGGVFDFVAAYAIPATATNPLTPYDTATITAVPVVSAAAIPYPAGTVSRTDTVNLTTGAAFAATKAIAAPAVAAPGASVGGWPLVATSGVASSSAACASTWTTGLTTSATCTYTVYTISYNNTGAATGAFSLSDTLPAGMTYVTGSAVWSGLGGTALAENGATTGTSPNLVSSTFAAGKFSATVSNVAPNTSGTISFVALVNSTASAGTGSTTNTALYSTTDCNAACASSTPPGTPSNPTPFPVTPSYRVIAANAATASSFDGSVPPLKSGVDLVPVASAYLGSKLAFPVWVINKGNVSDSFNISMAAVGSANNNFPAGTTFALLRADGVTPLLDTNGDGVSDTGPLATNASVALTVVASLPATGTVPIGAVHALVTASSTGAATSAPVIDSVWTQIDAIQSARLDLTNTAAGNQTSTDGGVTTSTCSTGSNCDVGQGPSPNPTFTTPTTPGKPAAFPLYLKNQETTDGSYRLTASLPPGWTVKFVPGNSNCSAAAVAQPVTVGSAAQVGVVACVTPPIGTSPGTTPITLTATKSTDPTVGDSLTDAVLVGQAVNPFMQLGPNNSTNNTPNGGTTVTPVLLTNTGNTSCGLNGGLHVAASLDAAARAAGWSVVVYYDSDKNGTITGTDPVIDTTVAEALANLTTALAGSLVPLAPAPGNVQGLPLLVKIFAPANAAMGSSATATLVVTDVNANPTTAAPACPATSGQYVVTVTSGQLSVQKTQLKVAGVGTAPSITCDGTQTTGFAVASMIGKPGDCIIYKIVATNAGNAAVTNVVLSDAVPPYTVYNTTQPAVQCVASNHTGTAAFTTVGSGAATTTMACSASGPTGLTLLPLGTLTLYFAVQLNQ